MQVPVYGNNAYQYDRSYYERPAVKPVKKVKVRVKKRKKVSVGSAILLGVAVLMAFCLLFRNSQLLERKDTVKNMQGELSSVHAQIVAKQFEIERNVDLNKVEEEAIQRLGMQRPVKAQMIYLDMENCDYAECSKQKETGHKNIFSALIDGAREYFG